MTVRLENVSRLPTGLLLAEDAIPYALGTRPRYVLDGVERGGIRELSYPLRSDLRGKFAIGPLEVRIADSFGLVELGRSFATTTTLVVTPRVVPLARSSVGAAWVGEGDGRARAAVAAGEDDVVPRAYRDGDELRRVHWRSTARYGELMVRREEQRWRNRAMLLLDTRRSAHAGSGVASSFEFAVSAAASIGVHVARGGMDGQLITDTGAVAAPGMFEDVLLDSLAVVKTSRGTDLSGGLAAIRASGGGLLIVVAGRLSAATARQLATSRRDGGPAIALLLAVSTWSAPGSRETDSPDLDAPGRDRSGPGQRPDGERRTAASDPAASRLIMPRPARPPPSWPAQAGTSSPWTPECRSRRRGSGWPAGRSPPGLPRSATCREQRYEPPADADRGRRRRAGLDLAVPADPGHRLVLGRVRRGHRGGRGRHRHPAARPARRVDCHRAGPRRGRPAAH